MNANTTLNMDQASVKINESSKSTLRIMTLPRELRDSIYEYLVGTKYRFDEYKIQNGEPHFSEPPTLSEARGDSSAPVSYDPAIGHSRFGTYGVFRHKAGEAPYKYPFPLRPSLSILEISEVREEALNVLYQKGTLLFVLNHRSHSFLFETQNQDLKDVMKQSQDLIKHFNNVEIFLDLASMFRDSLDQRDHIRATNVAMVLVKRFAESAGPASTCTLSTYWRYDIDAFERTFFLLLRDTVGNLCVFKKVVLRLWNRFTRAEDFADSPTKLAAERSSTGDWAVRTYREFLREEKFRCLGPFEENFDSEGFYCVVFHPKHQVDAGSD